MWPPGCSQRPSLRCRTRRNAEPSGRATTALPVTWPSGFVAMERIVAARRGSRRMRASDSASRGSGRRVARERRDQATRASCRPPLEVERGPVVVQAGPRGGAHGGKERVGIAGAREQRLEALVAERVRRRGREPREGRRSGAASLSPAARAPLDLPRTRLRRARRAESAGPAPTARAAVRPCATT